MNRLVPLDAYAGVFARWCGARARYVRPVGNVGDRLIDLATMQLFTHYGITVANDGADVCFWAGGGNMGDQYKRTGEIRRGAAARARRERIPFVILPQSWNAPDDTPWDEAFVRERESLVFAPEAILAPDLALAYSPTFELPPVSQREGWFFRQDIEGIQTGRFPGSQDPVLLCRSPEAYLKLAAEHGVIYTDRLHFAISGLIARRHVVLFPGSYFKNRAVWEVWLKDQGCEFEESC